MSNRKPVPTRPRKYHTHQDEISTQTAMQSDENSEMIYQSFEEQQQRADWEICGLLSWTLPLIYDCCQHWTCSQFMSQATKVLQHLENYVNISAAKSSTIGSNVTWCRKFKDCLHSPIRLKNNSNKTPGSTWSEKRSHYVHKYSKFTDESWQLLRSITTSISSEL